MSKKIVLISSGQPSLNPRLVKEADALVTAGYKVVVIYQYWNDWGTELDKELLANKKWTSICVGGNPIENKIIYWISRIQHKFGQILAKKIGFNHNVAELAIGRCTFILAKKAKNIKADLYIGHNLAAIPATVKAAKKNKAKCGFDAEDLHRYETSDDLSNFDVGLKTYIEDKYFPMVDYLSTSSDNIKSKYQSFFPNLDFYTIINVFPKNVFTSKIKQTNESLKLFWFSQTVGLSRGLQNVIQALKLTEYLDIEFHILGSLSNDISEFFAQYIKDLKFEKTPCIFFHQPTDSDELVNFSAQFDIGLALEPGFSINNDLALSNKIFTYVQAGLAIIASDTTAQKDFMSKYPGMGIVFEKGDALSVAKSLKTYIDEPKLLRKHQNQAILYAQTDLNWEKESVKLLTIIKNVLAS